MSIKDFLRRANTPGPAERTENRHKQMTRIRLYAPSNRLSLKMVHDLEIRGAILFAFRDLKYPLSAGAFLKDLDTSIEHIITMLDRSVRDGLEMTAEVSCHALCFAVKQLHIDTAVPDRKHEETLWAERVRHIRILEQASELCIDYDLLSMELAEQKARRRCIQAELLKQMDAYSQRRDSGALENLRMMKDELDEIDQILAAKQRRLEEIIEKLPPSIRKRCKRSV